MHILWSCSFRNVKCMRWSGSPRAYLVPCSAGRLATTSTCSPTIYNFPSRTTKSIIRAPPKSSNLSQENARPFYLLDHSLEYTPSANIIHGVIKRRNSEPRLTRYNSPTLPRAQNAAFEAPRRDRPPKSSTHTFPTSPAYSFTLMGTSRVANRSTASFTSASLGEKRFHSISNGVAATLLLLQSP
jgi:hypothetical protein